MSEQSRKMIVKINQEVCVGAGLCVLSVADVFDQRDEDGVVILRNPNPGANEEEAVLGAVRKCPAGAIAVEYVES